MLNKIEGLTFKIIQNELCNPEVQFYEEATDFLIIFLYYGSIRDHQGRTVSQDLWKLFPIIINSISNGPTQMSYGYEFFVRAIMVL